jgi:hypothetical protein
LDFAFRSRKLCTLYGTINFKLLCLANLHGAALVQLSRTLEEPTKSLTAKSGEVYGYWSKGCSMLLSQLPEEVLQANLELVRQGLVFYTFGAHPSWDLSWEAPRSTHFATAWAHAKADSFRLSNRLKNETGMM